tara:strand:+ start:2813 stop:3199 length:387 start_codon:yes stop_codon:yes gene_type:complete
MTTTILQIAESSGDFGKTMHTHKPQLAGVNEIRIAGRDYKRQSEFFDNQWSTTQNSVEFAAKAGIHVDQDDIVRWDSNNQEPFGDMLLDLHEAGLITLNQVEQTCTSREIRTELFWEDQFKKINMEDK